MAESPATSVNPGSQDCLPVTYPSITYARQIISEPGKIPFYVEVPIAPPVYKTLDVSGPSSLYLEHVARFGLVTLTVTRSNRNGKYGPAYIDVGVDGLRYKIQVGQPVSVPRNVLTVIQNSGTYTATAS